jgi:prolyl-tRNA synthetase
MSSAEVTDASAQAGRVTPRSADFASWYQEVIAHAELVDQAPVRGCMILRPNGYAIWEAIQQLMNPRFRKQGVRNAYFPLLIPLSFIQKEAEHVEGFSPELAVVTHAGQRELEEPLVIRPTSETVIWDTYRRWIHSHRDLPLLLNQWCNVVRWEKRPRAFLRTTEFLWQEGHTAHATAEDARTFSLRMLGVYLEFMQEVLGLSPIVGEKPAHERFAGAIATFTLEPMMQDGRALQAGTSHDLGDNFGRAFEVQYQGASGAMESVYATSWGVSTRLIGALVMAHGDDTGVVFPPAVAPVQVAIIPVPGKRRSGEVLALAEQISSELQDAGYRVEVDARPGQRLGAKLFSWERMGAAARIVIGEKELDSGEVLVGSRHDGQDRHVAVGQLPEVLRATFRDAQRTLLDRSRSFRESHTALADTREAMVNAVASGYALSRWCEALACAESVKDQTRATVRCFPLEFDGKAFHPRPDDPGPCAWCGAPARRRVIFARSY